MTDDQRERDLPPLALPESLSEINRTLESLRERISRLAGSQQPSPRSEPAGDQITPVDESILRRFEDILALPTSGLEPREMFEVAMERVGALLSADRVMLFLHDPGGFLMPRSARGFRREDLAVISMAPGEGVVGRAFQERKAFHYSRSAEGAATEPFVIRFPVRDAVAVPARVGDDVVGVLYAGRRAAGPPFTADMILLLLVAADRVATALAQERLGQRAGRYLLHLRELRTFSEQALVGRDLGAILSGACEVGRRMVGVEVAALAIPGESSGLVLAAASSGLPREIVAGWQADPDRGLAAEMFAARRPVAFTDLAVRSPMMEPWLADLGVRSCLLVPVPIRTDAEGILFLAGVEAREFSPDEIESAWVLGSLAALAIENDRLYGEVRAAFDRLRSTQDHLVQTEKARALGEMAGGVAHEFNNILAIILGKTQLLLARAPEEALREGLGMIEEAAWRAADIVRRLQGFAATNIEDTNGAVDVNSLVHDAVTLTRALWKDEAEACGVRIEVVTDLENMPVVQGNPAALREAVTNLLMNAIDAMPRGGRVSLTTRAAEGGVRLTVEDTGEGMSPEVRRRAFDPFFTTRGPLRTGLGLSVVYGITVRHRGRVELASAEGRGTSVIMWLSGGQAPVPTPAPPVETPPGEATGPASILVLEDEEQIRGLLVDALTQAGHRVESAADGLAGLARFQSGRFDVVLTDLSLPERSGLEVARAVKRMRPGTAVVLITGWGHLLDPARLRDSGVDLMLVKPFRLERVLSVLGDALRLIRGS